MSSKPKSMMRQLNLNAIVVLATLAVMMVASCTEFGVDPSFSSRTVLSAQFTLPTGLGASAVSTLQNSVYFDTTGVTSELRGGGMAAADVDSSFVTRLLLRSTEGRAVGNFNLEDLSQVTILVSGDTLAKVAFPEFTYDEYVVPDSALRPIAKDLPIAPGDSVAMTLIATTKNATTTNHLIIAELTVETIAKAKIE